MRWHQSSALGTKHCTSTQAKEPCMPPHKSLECTSKLTYHSHSMVYRYHKEGAHVVICIGVATAGVATAAVVGIFTAPPCCAARSSPYADKTLYANRSGIRQGRLTRGPQSSRKGALHTALLEGSARASSCTTCARYVHLVGSSSNGRRTRILVEMHGGIYISGSRVEICAAVTSGETHCVLYCIQVDFK